MAAAPDMLDEILAQVRTGQRRAHELDVEEDDGPAPPRAPVPFPPPEIHYTQLSRMSRSPAHYRAACLESFPSTPAMRFGQGVHGLILGGAKVTRFDAPKRAGKAWTAFRAEHHDKIILTAPEHDRAAAIAQKVRAHPLAGLQLEGEHEKTLRWSYMGRACAGRLDVVRQGVVVEVKTTPNAEPVWFRRHAWRMGYPAQLSWYRRGARANGYAVDQLFIVAVETRAPFAITVFELTDRAIEAAEKMVHAWMERLLACERADAWPEYSQCVVPLDAPDAALELEFAEDAEAA